MANREELQGVLKQALKQNSQEESAKPPKVVEENKSQSDGKQGVLEPGQTVYFDR